MPFSTCRFVQRVAEFVPIHQWKNVPDNTRGIYALLKSHGGKYFDVVYVGMSAGKTNGIYARLDRHRKNKEKDWDYFTIFEVHDNITNQEIRELEGLFRHMYRKDSRANKHNKQLRHKSFGKIAVSKKSLGVWNWPK